MIDLIKKLVDFIIHIDRHLAEIIGQYGLWTYGILFLIIFAETGLVVLPLLPGDSLLFAAGAFSAKPETGLNVHAMAFLLFVGRLPRRHAELLDRPQDRTRGVQSARTRSGCAKSTSIRRTRFSKSTAAAPSSWPVSSRSSAPSCPSSPAPAR
jgi:hypothetical protein